MINLALGDTEDAIYYIDRAVSIDPHDLDFRSERGEIYLLSGRVKEGLQILEEVISESGYYKAYLILAEYYERNGDEDGAIKYYKKALAAAERSKRWEVVKEIKAKLHELQGEG